MNILTKINQEITKQTLGLDDQIAKVEKDIPTFEAINVGAIIYSDNLKKCIQNEKEHIKVSYDLLKQTEDAIKLFKKDRDELKFDIAKGLRRFDLITNEIEERKKRNN